MISRRQIIESQQAADFARTPRSPLAEKVTLIGGDTGDKQRKYQKQAQSGVESGAKLASRRDRSSEQRTRPSDNDGQQTSGNKWQQADKIDANKMVGGDKLGGLFRGRSAALVAAARHDRENSVPREGLNELESQGYHQVVEASEETRASASFCDERQHLNDDDDDDMLSLGDERAKASGSNKLARPRRRVGGSREAQEARRGTEPSGKLFSVDNCCRHQHQADERPLEDYRNFDPYSVYADEDDEEDVWYSEERLFEVSRHASGRSAGP